MIQIMKNNNKHVDIIILIIFVNKYTHIQMFHNHA